MRRIALLIALLISLQANALAADTPVIVQLGPLGNILRVADVLGGSVVDTIPGTNTHLLSLPVVPTIITPVLSLLGVRTIEVVQPAIVRSPQSLSIFSMSGTASWYSQQPSMSLVRMSDAQEHAKGRGVIIADLNSRVDYGHPALAGHLTGGYDFVSARSSYNELLIRIFQDQSNANFLDQSNANFLDQSNANFLDQSNANFLDQSNANFLDQPTASYIDAGNPAHGHGTMCAGIIAVVAPESLIMPIRVFDDDGNADTFSIAKAIRYSVTNGADVINLSFGMMESSPAVESAVSYAVSKGVAVVASAGNNDTAEPQYPAAYSGVIAVAATDLQDQKASFSNYGSTVFVTAPGVNIISSYPGGYYAMASGTSYSAPMVAGEAALLRSVRWNATRSAVGTGTINITTSNPGYAGKLGNGRIDMMKALQTLQ